MPDQAGIPRRIPTSPRPLLRGGTDPVSLRADLEALVTYTVALSREIELAYDAFARRANEMLMSGTLANRPTAGVQDRVYFSTDQAENSRLSWDTGSSWVNE